jgi:hypothetical protein
MKLPYLQCFRDRLGKPRFYVRDVVAKRRSVAIKAAPDTPEFMQQYRDAIAALGLGYLPNLPVRRRHVMHWRRWQRTERDEKSVKLG